jgi:NADPH:quinone reductase-like Zn-dependent oxidoreductase
MAGDLRGVERVYGEGSMRAVVLRRFGGPDMLAVEDVAMPEPLAAEVLVRVEAAAINRIDLDIRAGISGNAIELPLILGREAAGRVLAVGEGVSAWWPGDRVLVLPQQPCEQCRLCRRGARNLCRDAGRPGVNRPGGYAEYTVAPTTALLRVPDSVDSESAACAAITLGTAWRALVTSGVIAAGGDLLVTGAAGGLGSACVAVGRHAGARIIAAVGSAEHGRFAAHQGAEVVIDYSRASLREAVLDVTGGAGVQAAIDPVGGSLFEEVIGCMAPGGHLMVAGAHAGEMVNLNLVRVFRNEINVRGVVSQTREEVTAVLDLIASGQLQPVVAAVYGMHDAPAAHALVASRAGHGKVVLRMG